MRILAGHTDAVCRARALSRYTGRIYRVFQDTSLVWNVERYEHERGRRMPAGDYYGPDRAGSGEIVLRGSVSDSGGVTIAGHKDVST